MFRPAMRFLVLLMVVFVLGFPAVSPVAAQVQSNAADLAGVVTDPLGGRIPGAQITARNLATNQTRTVSTGADGAYSLLALPPGRYEITVEAAGFNTQRNPEVELSIGTRSTLNVELQLATGQETVIVTADATLVETQRTAVAETISTRKIENLPINQRDYLNFTLLTSNAARDSAPSIGAAPTSGLNFGGQRGRSNLVSVDGADATDNSINGVRATVSQEAVQEFQIITNSYNPEFGRASGAVINIVTKGGSNEFHGNVFGFIRNKDFDADNPFSTVDDPAFTRFQGGFTLGGPFVKDRTFYFAAYERRQRREEGFSSIGQDNFGLVGFTTPLGVLPVTAEQAAFLSDPIALIALGGFDLADGINTSYETYLFLAAGSASVALNGINPFLVGVGLGATFPTTLAPLPPSFTLLNALRGNYPVKDDTDFYSVRLDHQWNENNNSFVRASFSPSDVTGIQVNAQNQTFGQNSFSRSSEQSSRDWSVVGQNVTIGSNWVNEARGQFARRGLSYTPSSFPGGPGEPLGGQGPGVNIAGFAFFGREPFSRVDRIERRYQAMDNFSYMRGNHTYKFGFDLNHIQVRPRLDNNQVFELNFGAVINFGALPETVFGFPDGIDLNGDGVNDIDIPSFTAVQAYGLGLPTTFIQGIGDSFSSFNNTAFAFYVQDSWRIRSNLTLNYGVRWDGERSPLLPAFNDLTAQAENSLGVLEGIPRDWNNWAPRIGLAWDPWGDSKTVIRAAYGLFYDHPLLALAFNSDTADGAQSVQLAVGPGLGCATDITTPITGLGCFNSGSIFQGILNAPAVFGFEPTQQRFNPFTPGSIFVNQNFCPGTDAVATCAGGFPMPNLAFTLPVAQDFDYGYAQQWNLTFEREVANNWLVSVSYLGVKGNSLNRPRNINTSDPALLILNRDRAVQLGFAAPGINPLLVGVSDAAVFAASCDPAASVFGIICFSAVGPVSSPAFFNFFRPSGPNFALFQNALAPFFVPDNATVLALAGAAGYPIGPGFFVPFADVLQQESSGSSIYHALSLNVRKRYGNHYELLASYTWSHAIDDSTDLQTLLAPQDNRRSDLERSDSTFDLRHRFVLSAVFESPYSQSDDNLIMKLLANFTISPIFEASTGRPFTVLSGSDFNLDFGSTTDRPSIGTGGISSPFISGVSFLPPNVCPVPSIVSGCTGNLGRNAFDKPNTWMLDLRIGRKIPFAERWAVDLSADFFNIFNRFNVADVNPLCDPVGGRCIAGQPTSVLDARQIQFGVKVSW